jgi:hypothetical protein
MAQRLPRKLCPSQRHLRAARYCPRASAQCAWYPARRGQLLHHNSHQAPASVCRPSRHRLWLSSNGSPMGHRSAQLLQPVLSKYWRDRIGKGTHQNCLRRSARTVGPRRSYWPSRVYVRIRCHLSPDQKNPYMSL